MIPPLSPLLNRFGRSRDRYNRKRYQLVEADTENNTNIIAKGTFWHYCDYQAIKTIRKLLLLLDSSSSFSSTQPISTV